MLGTGSPSRTGQGHYLDEYDWDLLYPIGQERFFIFDHKGLGGSPDDEYLVIRLDHQGIFESWFLYGSKRWPSIVGEPGRKSYRPTR
jgi:hypothetical protein